MSTNANEGFACAVDLYAYSAILFACAADLFAYSAILFATSVRDRDFAMNQLFPE